METVSFVKTADSPFEFAERVEQVLVPRPLGWPILTLFLQDDPRVSNVKIGIEGLIEIEFNGATVCAVADYRVESNAAAPNPNRSLVLLPSADQNDDGASDYSIYYPDGSRQTLYLLPSQGAPEQCD